MSSIKQSFTDEKYTPPSSPFPVLRRDGTERNKVVGGTLYLVATPIGNLDDLSFRAVKVLSEVDFIAAEDTRNSAKLLAALGIGKPMVSYFEHNKRERGEQILTRLRAGESCALITDAGTPAISDPGENLVAQCIAESIPVTAIPGCCAGINALVLSGLATGPVCLSYARKRAPCFFMRHRINCGQPCRTCRTLLARIDGSLSAGK